MCATAINMGAAGGLGQQYEDHLGNNGFCLRTEPGAGAQFASSCWKVRCVGDDNALGVGVSCKDPNNWMYVKTVDTNVHGSWSLTDDRFIDKCDKVHDTQATTDCRAFDITLPAWNELVVFSNNQANPGQPAGLNGIIPMEYVEVCCSDPKVHEAIHRADCGSHSDLTSLLV